MINVAFTVEGPSAIAQNDFIEINGTNLAPASVGSGGLTWSNAPAFASGMMPTQLNGVTVTVDGKPAFVEYVSPTQVNILPPLDSTIGPVQITLTNNGTSSAPFMVQERTASPSLLLFDSTHVVATHSNGSLLGRTSLSVPGYPFTPAKPGETVVIYAVGFGLPLTTLVNGSSSQSAALPTMPPVQIGGAPANVSFAGVVEPGLYQLNVTIPTSAAAGDNPISCTYNGISTETGTTIAVQP